MPDIITKAQVLQAAATVMSGFVSAHKTPLEDVASVFKTILESVSGAAKPGGNIAGLEPAAKFEDSVANDYIICMVCGRRMRSLKQHLRTVHDLTPEAYRTLWNLPDDYPIVAETLSKSRSIVSRRVQADFKAEHGIPKQTAAALKRRAAKLEKS